MPTSEQLNKKIKLLVVVKVHLPVLAVCKKPDSPADELRGFDTFNALLGLDAEE